MDLGCRSHHSHLASTMWLGHQRAIIPTNLYEMLHTDCNDTLVSLQTVWIFCFFADVWKETGVGYCK